MASSRRLILSLRSGFSCLHQSEVSKTKSVLYTAYASKRIQKIPFLVDSRKSTLLHREDFFGSIFHGVSLPKLRTKTATCSVFKWDTKLAMLLCFSLQIATAIDDSQFQQAVREESDFLIDCGISKINWTFSEKADLELVLCKSSVIYRTKAAIDQFVDGLETVGLLRYIKENPASFKEMFCYAKFPLTVASFRKLLTVNYTEPGSNDDNKAREGEEATVLWWEDFLDKLDQSDPEGLLPQLLIFITGADNIPFLGFHKNIDIEFFDIDPRLRRFPMTSTCGLRLKLPRGIPSYEEFEGLIIRAIKEGSHDFGKL